MTEFMQTEQILNSKKAYTNEPIGKQGRCILTWMKPRGWGVWVRIDEQEVK